jgi:hypothetical protein
VRATCRAPHKFPVALAAGKHLFPFRTEKLSPPAPMVLGGRPPGRVGRRRSIRSWGRVSIRPHIVRHGRARGHAICACRSGAWLLRRPVRGRWGAPRASSEDSGSGRPASARRGRGRRARDRRGTLTPGSAAREGRGSRGPERPRHRGHSRSSRIGASIHRRSNA